MFLLTSIAKMFGLLISLIFLLFLMLNALLYLSAFYLSNLLFQLIGLNSEADMKLFAISIALSSLIAFILTLCIYLFFKWRKYEQAFKTSFVISYLTNTYLWGLLSAIGLLKPVLIQENVFLESDFFDQSLVSSFGILFFISITNYTLFKHIVFDGIYKDIWFGFKKLIKSLI